MDTQTRKPRKKTLGNTEALPEGSVLVFPIALKETGWKPFGDSTESEDLYFGGLESIGFGHCRVKLAGDY